MSNNRNTSASSLYEGTFSVGVDKKFNRIDRTEAPAKGALKISLNPFLIRTADKNILFDVGIGDFGEDTGTDTIRENLADHQLTEYDITDIFVSHLHYDHIGGLAGRSAGYWELTFPDANIWVSEKGWNKILAMDTYYDNEKTDFAHFIDAKANLCFLDDKDQPYPEMSVAKVGGHTEFSQALFFDDGNQKYIMAGDVLATRGEVNRKFAAKYDYDGKRSMEVRKQLTKKAYEEHYMLLGYHDSHHSIFQLTDFNENHGYAIENVDAGVSA